MKILITTDWSDTVVNGVVMSIRSLTEGLRAMGNEVKILTLSNGRHSYSRGDVIYIGSVSVGMIYPNARLKSAPSGKYVRDLIEWHPDVIHSQCEFSTFYLAKKISKACGCPLVHTYHTVYEDFTHYFSPSVRLGRYMAAIVSRIILSDTQEVIAPTGKIEKMLQGYGVKTPISVIPTGLQLENFREIPDPPHRAALREKFGIAPSDSVLIYLGRIAKEKSINELVDLLSEWNRNPENLHLKLVLVGDGPYRQRVENMIEKMKINSDIIFTGMVSPQETVDYYTLGDIFVSASRSETQGLTYIEAMACAMPLLCRKDPCLDDVIKEGVNGLTYNTKEEFFQKLDMLLGDREYRERIGSEARETVFERFSSRSFAEKALEVYQRNERRNFAESL